jgi:heme exporter protein A
MLKVNEIGFKRHEVWLWNNISFELGFGQFLQISGANGSGKTTLLRILTALATPHTGEIYWQEKSIFKNNDLYHSQLQYIGHQCAVKAELTVEENLRLNTAKINRSSLESTLEKTGLTAHKNHFAYQISQGQKQRVALARLLLSSALIWILDEPLAGLDTEMIQQCQTWFYEHLSQGGIIIMSSHQNIHLEKVSNLKLHLS